MPFVTIDGQPLHYIDQGTGPAVLLAGSYLWDQAMWAPQIAALSQHYRVIALDLWGHGESGPLPAGTTSLDDIARQALALLDHLDIDRVTLVGLSVGGMWGVRLALSAPQRLNGLVLMDTYVGVEPEPTRQYYFSLFKHDRRNRRDLAAIAGYRGADLLPSGHRSAVGAVSGLPRETGRAAAGASARKHRADGADYLWPG